MAESGSATVAPDKRRKKKRALKPATEADETPPQRPKKKGRRTPTEDTVPASVPTRRRVARKTRRPSAAKGDGEGTDGSSSDDADILAEARAELQAEGVSVAKDSLDAPEWVRRDIARSLAVLKSREDDDTMKVFLARCPLSITERHLLDHWKDLGPDSVKHITWGQGRAEIGSPFKGWAIVTFATTSLAMKAAAMKPPVVNGQEIVVRWKGYTPIDEKRPAFLLRELRRKRESLDATIPEEEKPTNNWRKQWLQGRTLHPVEWKDDELAGRPFNRDFYAKCVRPKRRSPGEIAKWVTAHAICRPPDSPPPILEFAEVDFGKEVHKVLAQKYTAPFPIQSLAWPVLLQGRDCIGIAQTGSGKTLAYALPAIVHLNAQPRPTGTEGPVVLVLAPTRELIIQICAELEKYQLAGGLRIGVAYGGQDGKSDRATQADLLMRGVDIVGGTPGRLCDFVEAGILPLSRVTFLVIDEADALLEMGFIDQTAALVLQTRPDRQTVLFSATWIAEVQQMADNMLTDAVRLAVGGSQEEPAEANRDVEQRVVLVDTVQNKLQLLANTIQQLRQHDPTTSRTIVFVGIKRMVALVAKFLTPRWPRNVYSICGDLHQTVRETIIRRFREDPKGILVATDLVARGLDILDLVCVINFSLPRDIEQYIHRIGRTGRAGEKGLAVSFFSQYVQADCKMARDLVQCITNAGQTPPEFLVMFAKGQLKRQPHPQSVTRGTPDNRWGPENPAERVDPEPQSDVFATEAPEPEGPTPRKNGWVRTSSNPFTRVKRTYHDQ